MTRPLVFAGEVGAAGVAVGGGAARATESGAAMAISDSFNIVFSVFIGVFMGRGLLC